MRFTQDEGGARRGWRWPARWRPAATPASDDEGGADVKVDEDAASNFDDGTRMKELADAGKITIGVKFDQPGIGFKGAADDEPTGFDLEMGKILAASLGIARGQDHLEGDDLRQPRAVPRRTARSTWCIASYSITDERRKIVGQAGPYYVTGQQLLVKKDSDIKSVADIKGKEVCSVTGSTSLDNVEAKGAKPRGFDTYSECVTRCSTAPSTR